MAFWRYGARFRRATRAHYTTPVPWTLGLLWPTTPVPGVPITRYSPSQATLPAGQFYSCTPPNGYRAFTQHHRQNDLLFVNLTNPLTNIKLTPGSLGWESLLPPLIHSPHAFHIHSTHTLGPAVPHSLIVDFSLTSFTPTLTLCYSTNYLPLTISCSPSSLILMHVPFNLRS